MGEPFRQAAERAGLRQIQRRRRDGKEQSLLSGRNLGDGGRWVLQDDAGEAELERFQRAPWGGGAVQQSGANMARLGEELLPPEAARIERRTRCGEQGDGVARRQCQARVLQAMDDDSRRACGDYFSESGHDALLST